MVEEKCVSMLFRADTLVIHSRKAQTTSSSVQDNFIICWTPQIQH